MRFNILSDIDWESRVDQILDALTRLGYFEFFAEKDYGNGLYGVTVVFMCQDPNLNLKRRVRHSKREKKIYMDIMLDLPTMRAADNQLRQKILADRLNIEVPEILGKYKITDFDSARFISDLRLWLAATKWMTSGVP